MRCNKKLLFHYAIGDFVVLCVYFLKPSPQTCCFQKGGTGSIFISRVHIDKEPLLLLAKRPSFRKREDTRRENCWTWSIRTPIFFFRTLLEMDDRIYTQQKPSNKTNIKKTHEKPSSLSLIPIRSNAWSFMGIRQPQGQHGKNGHVQNPEISVAENQLIML